MLRVWNVSLVIVTFFLTLFGTFMTRSGIVQSMHAFGEDPARELFHRLHDLDAHLLLRVGDLPAAAAACPPRAGFLDVEGSGVPVQ